MSGTFYTTKEMPNGRQYQVYKGNSDTGIATAVSLYDSKAAAEAAIQRLLSKDRFEGKTSGRLLFANGDRGSPVFPK